MTAPPADVVSMANRVEALRALRRTVARQLDARQSSLKQSLASGGRFALAHEAVIGVHERMLEVIDQQTEDAVRQLEAARR